MLQTAAVLLPFQTGMENTLSFNREETTVVNIRLHHRELHRTSQEILKGSTGNNIMQHAFIHRDRIIKAWSAERLWPLNSTHFIVIFLMYVVAHMSYFLTLVSIPRWETCKTKKGDSFCSLGFLRVSNTFNRKQSQMKMASFRPNQTLWHRHQFSHTF